MMGPYWHMSNGGMWTTNMLGFMLEILAWIIIAVLVIVLYTRYLSSNRQNNRQAIDILKLRYAKGEISKEEFERMKEHLK